MRQEEFMSCGGFDFFPSVSWLSLTLSSEMCFQFARNGNWAEWNVLPAQKNTSAAGLQVDLRVIYCAMSACTSVCLCVCVCKCACAIIHVPSAAVFDNKAPVFFKKYFLCLCRAEKCFSGFLTKSQNCRNNFALHQDINCDGAHSLHFFLVATHPDFRRLVIIN